MTTGLSSNILIGNWTLWLSNCHHNQISQETNSDSIVDIIKIEQSKQQTCNDLVGKPL